MSTESTFWYQGYLSSRWWKILKKRILQNVQYVCSVRKCRANRNLEFHHIDYSHIFTDREFEDIRLLCHMHHRLAHYKWFRRLPLQRKYLLKRYVEVQRAGWMNIKPGDLVNSFFKFWGQLLEDMVPQ